MWSGHLIGLVRWRRRRGIGRVALAGLARVVVAHWDDFLGANGLFLFFLLSRATQVSCSYTAVNQRVQLMSWIFRSVVYTHLNKKSAKVKKTEKNEVAKWETDENGEWRHNGAVSSGQKRQGLRLAAEQLGALGHSGAVCPVSRCFRIQTQIPENKPSSAPLWRGQAPVRFEYSHGAAVLNGRVCVALWWCHGIVT